MILHLFLALKQVLCTQMSLRLTRYWNLKYNLFFSRTTRKFCGQIIALNNGGIYRVGLYLQQKQINIQKVKNSREIILTYILRSCFRCLTGCIEKRVPVISIRSYITYEVHYKQNFYTAFQSTLICTSMMLTRSEVTELYRCKNFFFKALCVITYSFFETYASLIYLYWKVHVLAQIHTHKFVI